MRSRKVPVSTGTSVVASRETMRIRIADMYEPKPADVSPDSFQGLLFLARSDCSAVHPMGEPAQSANLQSSPEGWTCL